ncbi:MAG: recombination factor protein RarA [Gammaproteobacteria bacterium RIFCSPHIGHO2_12_FULL_40_19]|nr:MAG: recombination factor protein RarA [Gammaproteobacteria bacterium RIFCSPHIGHO2_12_FULL_40_19]
MRPQSLDQFAGQSHLLSPGKPLAQAILNRKLHSMILWGPPGVGKTALAELIASSSNARIERLSAVLSGVKEIREVVARAESRRAEQATVLFVDEVHRFNKAQQDAFLPHIENGTIFFIGATTENPSFHLNNALLSRARVYVLKPLDENDLLKIIDRALIELNIILSNEFKIKLAQFSNGDARVCVNLLEILGDFVEKDAEGNFTVTDDLLQNVLTQNLRRFDKGGDEFYDQISALHKSVRGSDPDAALYWFSRMIDGGCDVDYIARRMVRMASEDIGNADPRALSIIIDAWQAYERLGSPEGDLMLAQAVIYLACAAKSNAVYTAFSAARSDVEKYGHAEVPLHLRNAPTKLMKQLDYGKNYRYAHDESDAFAAGETYFPEKIKQTIYYEPVNRGLEIQIKEKLDGLRRRNKG